MKAGEIWVYKGIGSNDDAVGTMRIELITKLENNFWKCKNLTPQLRLSKDWYYNSVEESYIRKNFKKVWEE